MRSVADLVERVLPHFEENPLLSSKRREFELFAEVGRRMCPGEHLTREGFERILDLAFEMNPSGNRKYSKAEIKI